MIDREYFPSVSLTSATKIWDNAEHNALTDLRRYRNHWYCTFRESNAHVFGQDGAIRILFSQDGSSWKSVTLLRENGIDLRDPKLSVTPTGRLMLLVGGSVYKGKQYITRRSMVTFSDDGTSWEPFRKILSPHQWLWRLTWEGNVGYGVYYTFKDPAQPQKDWVTAMVSTEDGINYQPIVQWDIPGKPNECTLRIDNDKRMIALLRREEWNHRNAWIGQSTPPYREWQWHETQHHIGGPNFLILPTGQMVAGGRIVERNPYGTFEKTALMHMTVEDLFPILYLPSGGVDCSYPGMVFHDGSLWISYYSSHEEKTAIYLAKAQITPQKS